MRVGWSLLGANNTLSGVAVLGDLGWSREEKNVLCGKISKASVQTSDGSGRQIKNLGIGW